MCTSQDRKDKSVLHRLHASKVQMDNASPAWPEAFWIDYYFEYKQG
jgi:hypothetical protein